MLEKIRCSGAYGGGGGGDGAGLLDAQGQREAQGLVVRDAHEVVERILLHGPRRPRGGASVPSDWATA